MSSTQVILASEQPPTLQRKGPACPCVSGKAPTAVCRARPACQRGALEASRRRGAGDPRSDVPTWQVRDVSPGSVAKQGRGHPKPMPLPGCPASPPHLLPSHIPAPRPLQLFPLSAHKWCLAGQSRRKGARPVLAPLTTTGSQPPPRAAENQETISSLPWGSPRGLFSAPLLSTASLQLSQARPIPQGSPASC